jgi:hypothetical protein
MQRFVVTSRKIKTFTGLVAARMAEQAAAGGQQNKFTVGIHALPISHTMALP